MSCAVEPELAGSCARVPAQSKLWQARRWSGCAPTSLCNGRTDPVGEHSVQTHSPRSETRAGCPYKHLLLALLGAALLAPDCLGQAAPPYRLLRAWDAGPEVKEVHSLCFDQKGDLILVDSIASRVHRYTVQGQRVGEIGRGPGNGPGQFAGPRDAKVSPSGEIFVSDGNNQRIQVFAPDGSFLRMFGSKGNGPGQLLRGHAIDFGPDGKLFVADVDNSRIAVFDAEGKFLYAWGRAGKGPGLFQAPHGLGVDPEGNLFVSNYYGPCQKFGPDGRFFFEFAPAGFRGWIHFHSMATDRRGNVYLAARDADRRNAVVMFNHEGRFLREWSATAGRGVRAIAVDKEGLVYLAADSRDFHGVEVFGP